MAKEGIFSKAVSSKDMFTSPTPSPDSSGDSGQTIPNYSQGDASAMFLPGSGEDNAQPTAQSLGRRQINGVDSAGQFTYHPVDFRYGVKSQGV